MGHCPSQWTVRLHKNVGGDEVTVAVVDVVAGVAAIDVE
jgi:hypothetical protein